MLVCFLSAFPPNFNKYPLSPNTYGILGGNVTLLCQPEAAPTAEKRWMKDGADFTASTTLGDRVVQLANGNIHITGLVEEDAGNYTCFAKNTLGEANTTGHLSILRELMASFK